MELENTIQRCSITTKILQPKLNRKVCEIENMEIEGSFGLFSHKHNSTQSPHIIQVFLKQQHFKVSVSGGLSLKVDAYNSPFIKYTSQFQLPNTDYCLLGLFMLQSGKDPDHTFSIFIWFIAHLHYKHLYFFCCSSPYLQVSINSMFNFLAKVTA